MNAKELITEYLNFSGMRTAEEIRNLLDKTYIVSTRPNSAVAKTIVHIRVKLGHAYHAACLSKTKSTHVEVDGSGISNDQLGKFTDRGHVPDGGRQDEYWRFNRPVIQFEPRNVRIRKGPALPDSLRLDDEFSLIRYFGLRGVEYGQWLTQQDRVNYLAGCALALYDLSTVLNFHPKQIGLYDILSVAFGARGRGKALGHFEPSTFAVNLTRFKRPPKVRNRRDSFDRSEQIHFSGGIGTFCHEFGHALDYYGGMFIEKAPAHLKGKERKQWLSLSFHRSTRTFPDKELMGKSSLRGKMERLLNKIIWASPGVFSDYYDRVIWTCKSLEINSEYWVQRNELFARAFEVYVLSKMHQKVWFNTFLQRFKYDSPMYMTGVEFKSVEKEFDALIAGLRGAIRSGVGSFERLPIHQQMRTRKTKSSGKK